MSDPIPGNEFPITHYNGAEDPPIVQIPQVELLEEFINKQMVLWNRVDEADLTFLQDVLSFKGCPEYNGYMTRSSREQGHALQEKTKVFYLPLLNLKPSDESLLLLLSTLSLDPYLWGESDHPAFGPPASLSLHLASSSITPVGSVHKSGGDSVVRMWVQLDRWCVSCVWVLQRGHSGDGCDLESTLCKYDLRMGDLFARSCAKVRRVRRGSISSVLLMCGGGVRSILLLPLVARCLETMSPPCSLV